MAETPPSRSYRLFSGLVWVGCATAVFSAARTAAAVAVTASPATTPRLAIGVERSSVMVVSLARGAQPLSRGRARDPSPRSDEPASERFPGRTAMGAPRKQQ